MKNGMNLVWISLSVVLLALGFVTQQAYGQKNAWTQVAPFPAALAVDQAAWVQPEGAPHWVLNLDILEDHVVQAPMERADGVAVEAPIEISLPTPDGTFARFHVVKSMVMHPELARKFPDIRTYRGVGLDDPHASLRMDRTPKGFHAQVLSPNGSFYIDPFWRDDATVYTSYRKSQLARKDFVCGVKGGKDVVPNQAPQFIAPASLTTGTRLRTYRLAVSAQGEYTDFHGGTVGGALAAIVTTVNRVTGIFERDFAVRLELVANNNLIVYTNSVTDPFSENGSTDATLIENHANTVTVIGNANFDVGHLFNTGGGGLAGLGVVCRSIDKGEGAVGSPSPMGDPFDVDFVAHEFGHQFGADHTFNGTSGNCSGGNRNATTAFEPGSGSTIMSYAGICGVDDVQDLVNPYFHATSLKQVFDFLNTQTCDANVASGNTLPTVDAGDDFTIPAQTPFVLTALASDAEDVGLTYCWEEMDLGPALALSGADNGSSPLFRSRNPVSEPSRFFPELGDILGSTSDDDERLPTLGRAMTFRVTVRDNRLNGGGTDSDDMQVTVDAGAGPFLVTFPNTAVSIAGNQTVTWNVANTAAAAVNTPHVNILLSIDGGQTFGTVLAANTPNDGSQLVSLPALSTTTARIKVEGAGNIFFDISNADFTITLPPAPAVFAYTGVNAVLDVVGNGNGSGAVDPGETELSLSLQVQNSGVAGATGVSATLTSLAPTAAVTGGSVGYPDIGSGATGMSAIPFVFALDGSHVCGEPVRFLLEVRSNEATNSMLVNLDVGRVVTVTHSYDVSNTPIPEGFHAANVSFSVPHAGFITDLDFRFDGSVCSTDSSSPLVGLNHSWVGDLTVTLISPSGTSVVLMDRPGSEDNNGNNFCNTVFDDDGAFPSIQTITSAGAPFTGTFAPQNPLSAFDGEASGGSWTLRVADGITPDSGEVNSFSIVLSTRVCDPPFASEVAFSNTSTFVVNDAGGNGNNNGFVDPGETALTLTLGIKNSGTTNVTSVTGVLTSLSSTVSVLLDTSVFADMPVQGTASNAVHYLLSVDTNHVCGAPIALRMTVLAAEGGDVIDFSLPTGAAGLIVVTNAFTVSTAIPDGPGGLVDIPFVWPDSGPIQDVDFRFDGSVCSTDSTSALVGLNHSWVGDLTVTLISPSGTSVVLMDRPGSEDNNGNNFCNTVLNDDGSFADIQSVTSGENPYTGTFAPLNALSAFDGEEAAGSWTLRVQDSGVQDVGRVNAFSLIIAFPSTCASPVSVGPRTITASAGDEGAISPSGSVVVPNGGATNFQISADTYYYINAVLTNGAVVAQSFGPGATIGNVVWSNIVADGTIHASFGENLATNQTPEWWLALHALTNIDFNAQALLDQDGDGLAAWAEHKAGTDPTNAASVFAADLLPGFVVTWSSVSNKLYDVWRSTNLVSSASLISSNLPATPPMNVYTDTAPDSVRAYYFIGVQP